MARLHRFLSITNSTASQVLPDSAASPDSVSVESDFVVILAALLCAVICVVGLIAVARCSWLRRGTAAEVARRSKPANKGLNKKTLQSLPVTTYDVSKEGFETECAICLAEYVSGEEIRVLPQCGHGFHVGCIDTWLSSHSSCPSCRQVLVVGRCQKCGECGKVSGGGDTTAVGQKSGQEVAGSSEFLP